MGFLLSALCGLWKVLWCVPEPDYISSFGYRLVLCTASANWTPQFFVQTYFSCKYNILFAVCSGRNLSPALIYTIANCCASQGAALLLLWVLSSLQAADLYPTHLTHSRLKNAMKDVSASNTKYVLFFWKRVTRDGASIARILARHLQTNFIALPMTIASKWTTAFSKLLAAAPAVAHFQSAVTHVYSILVVL